MNKFRDRNLLFFCSENTESREFISQLNKNEPLKKQFILIDQKDSRLKIPKQIADLKQPLILIANGVNHPIIGKEALFWLMNNGFSERGNGLEYCSLTSSSQTGAMLDEKGDSSIGGTSRWSLLGEKTQNIETMEDDGRSKSNEFDQRLNRLKQDRNQLLDQQNKRPMNF